MKWITALCLGLVSAGIGFTQGATPTRVLPLAHWSFDEEDGGKIFRNGVCTNGWQAQADRPLPRSRGIHDKALQLRGTHAVLVRPEFGGLELPAISFAAWVRPMELVGFREIFRQESERRLLFSFQESGSILSLGLNIAGYVECDAAIDPASVLDGCWHHCAATFDGAFMRVYLDGLEIASMRRPGKVFIDEAAPAFIGSLGGTSEHFQGELDDLRVYDSALSGADVCCLWRAGVAAQQRLLAELEQRLGPIMVSGGSFAETLVSMRQRLTEQETDRARDLAPLAYAKLVAAFPGESRTFRDSTGIMLLDYMLSKDCDLNLKLAGRLVELMLEYKPLTEAQWKRQKPTAVAAWAVADAIKTRFDALVRQGNDAQFSPDWVRVILEASARIQLRPSQYEAVAPYARPETPVTRTLTAIETRQVLERDWLHQARQNPTPELIRSEIQWTHELAQRIQVAHQSDVDFEPEFVELKKLSQQAKTITGTSPELYYRVRELKRGIMFKNPVLDFDKVLFVDMPFPQGSEWRHETRHRLGYMAVPGARLLVLEGLGPDGKLKQLMPQAPLHGAFWRPDVSFDGTRIVFSFKPHNEKSFHLYEINADGTGLVQLTDGPFDDFDPVYLPDEKHLIFSTTRAHTYVRCMPPTSSFVLARCERDGSNMYFISANNEPDYLPSVMNDGRILYTRWEYTDKPLWRAQKLWTVHPDGTQVVMFWGNQSVWPDVTKDARSIPGSRRVMFTGSAHHDWFAGSVGIIDPDTGLNFPHGLTKVTADVAWPECGNGSVDPVESTRYHASGDYPAYYSPYPLSDQDFLVSAQREGKFVLYLMDVDGNRELVYEGAHQIFHPIPLKPRTKPPVIPDQVAWPELAERDSPKPGVIYSGDVYAGAPAELRGKARFLRIFSIDAKTYTYWYKRPYISTGPVVSAVQSEGVKRLLGTVPIEQDGSVAFKAPAGLSLHFQLLDEQQRAMQTMRSFVNVMPGEYRGCLGCHESHSRAPETVGQPRALKTAPHAITAPPWPDQTVSYPRYVQPVLDRYCGKCHQGEGEGCKVLDLTERPSPPVFTEPYLTLIGRPSWGSPYQPPENPPAGFGIAGCLMVEGFGTVDPQAYVTPEPMTSLSYRSQLIELVSSGKHHGVKVDEISRLRLIAWVDAMCPYMGDEEIREIPDPVFQGVEWLAVRPRIASAPRIVRPGPVKD